MRPRWNTWIRVLLFAIVMTGCTQMDGPEAAAKTAFIEWAQSIRTPYRNESFQTLTNDNTLATVRITVELLTKAQWTVKQVDIPCRQVESSWQCDPGVFIK